MRSCQAGPPRKRWFWIFRPRWLVLGAMSLALVPVAQAREVSALTGKSAYAAALCYALKHNTPVAAGYKVSDWVCKPGPRYGAVQMYFVEVTVEHEGYLTRIQYTVYPDGNISSVSNLWKRRVGPTPLAA